MSNTGPEIQLSCSATTKKDSSRPSSAYVDITVIDTKIPLDLLKGGAEICILENKQLMKKSYCENGAQQLYYVNVSEFNENYSENFPFRIYLYQPSVQWITFELKALKAFGKAAATIPNQNDIFSMNYNKLSISSLIINDLKVLSKKLQTNASQSKLSQLQLSGYQDNIDTNKNGPKSDKKKKRKESSNDENKVY